jgi:hypothetical protein
MSVPFSSRQPSEITLRCGCLPARHFIMRELEIAHAAGWRKANWEGSLEASARIVKALGLESKIGDQ